MSFCPPSASKPLSNRRIAFFDVVRGFTVLSMVAFHATYDAVMLFGFSVPWFENPYIQDAWRASISWTFLFLAGWMASFSRNNARRGAIYGVMAFLIWAVTSLAQVDTPINFGILFCMAASTLICSTFAPHVKKLAKPFAPAAFALSLIAFVITLGVPRHVYSFEGFAWLGFPSPTFASGDYYPLIPFFFMYLAGVFASRLFAITHEKEGYPTWMKRNCIPPLTFIGRHSLAVYLIHQPIILLMFEAITALQR